MTLLAQVRTLLGGDQDEPGPRVVVFGDSHTAALARAREFLSRKHLYEHIKVQRICKRKDDRIVGDTELTTFCRQLRKYGENDFVFSAIGGNQYTIVSTIKSATDYDFLSSAADQDFANDDAELIPHRVVAEYIDSGVRGTDAPVLREIRNSTRGKLFHLIPPPPKEQNDFIERQFESRFNEGMTKFGPTRPDLRLKAWTMQTRSLVKLCSELGIEPVLPPKEGVTAGGFLDPNCYGDDVTHANRRYGELVLKQIVEITRSGRATGEQPV